MWQEKGGIERRQEGKRSRKATEARRLALGSDASIFARRF